MQPDPTTRPEYNAAFQEIVSRIVESLSGLPDATLPIKMYVAGGAAMHFYTGARLSIDIDAAFSHRILLPDNLDVSYRDADGNALLLYLDRQYNEAFALIHEDAHEDSVPLELDGVDAGILDVRLLSPLDLAVSKISRLSDKDRADITSLTTQGLISAEALRRRAQEAASAYIGNQDVLKTSILLACRLVEDVEAHRGTLLCLYDFRKITINLRFLYGKIRRHHGRHQVDGVFLQPTTPPPITTTRECVFTSVLSSYAFSRMRRILQRCAGKIVKPFCFFGG